MSSEANMLRNLAGQTIGDLMFDLVDTEVWITRMQFVLVPSKEKGEEYIEKRIEAGYECHCPPELHATPEDCLRSHVVVDERFRSESMLQAESAGDDVPEDLVEAYSGAQLGMILFVTGSMAAQVKGMLDATIPMVGMMYGIPPGNMYPNTLAEALLKRAESGEPIEDVGEFLRSIGMSDKDAGTDEGGQQ